MKRRLHLIAAALFVLTLGYDLWLWGGLARHAEFGPALQKSGRYDVSLASLYLQSGAPLLDLTGLGLRAAADAEAAFRPVLARVRASPMAAMDNLQQDMPAGAKACYFGAPLLLVLAVLLWWRRPREVHIGRRR